MIGGYQGLCDRDPLISGVRTIGLVSQVQEFRCIKVCVSTQLARVVIQRALLLNGTIRHQGATPQEIVERGSN